MGGLWTTLMVLLSLIAIGGGIYGAYYFMTSKKSAAGAGVSLLVGIGCIFVFAFLASFRPVPANKIAVVTKNALGSSLESGAILAMNNEMGPSVDIRREGWHSGLWPFVYDVEYHDIMSVPQGQVGIIEALDGSPLPNGSSYAPQWRDLGQFLDARSFLNSPTGYKGPQATTMPPGQHVYHPKLFRVSLVPATIIAPGEVGVIKSNVGSEPPADLVINGIVPRHSDEMNEIGEPEEYRGIWAEPFSPQTLYLNPNAYYCIKVPTTVSIVDYTASEDNNDEFTQASLESTIDVKTLDGFRFPVEVRIEYRIQPDDAATVVAFFYDERSKGVGRKLRQKMNSTVRSVFRNNAEAVGALAYVNNRSGQETSCFELITDQMESFGVTITKVAIGDIDPNNSSPELAALLKTQTDKQIAVQEEQTFVQQQAAAREEQKLNDEQQRAIEAKRLATEEYNALIAEQTALRAEREAQGRANAARVEADAEAYATRIQQTAIAEGILAVQRAEAQGYYEKANAVGGTNLAMIELFDRVADGEIIITPEIVVGGGGSGADNGSGTINGMFALMLRQMMSEGGMSWKPKEVPEAPVFARPEPPVTEESDN